MFSNRQCVRRDDFNNTATLKQLTDVCSGAKLSNKDRELVTFTAIYDLYFVELEMI